MKPERVSELMTAAYHAMGYRVFTFPDGSIGCPQVLRERRRAHDEVRRVDLRRVGERDQEVSNVIALRVDTRVVDFHRAAVKAVCEHRLIDAVRLELDALELDPSFEEAETVIAWALKIGSGRVSAYGFELYT